MTATLDLPQGTQTRILFPVLGDHEQVLANGHAQKGTLTEDAHRMEIHLGPGHYVLHAQ